MAASSTGITRVTERVGTAITTPLGITIGIPLLVLSIALFIGFNGKINLQHSMQSMAEARFDDHVNMMRQQTQTLLNKAPALLDQFASYLKRTPKVKMDLESIRLLKLLIRNSPGVSWISYSNEEGSFWGVYLNHKEEMRYVTASQIEEPRGQWREYIINVDNTLTEVLHDEKRAYDPRARDWYADTKRIGKRRWTEPYIFINDNSPGITCADPIFAADGSLRGVMTVDFTLYHLSQSLHDICNAHGCHLFLFTDKLDILAHPQVSFEPGENKEAKLVNMVDVRDQTLLSFADVIPPTVLRKHEKFTDKYKIADREYMGMVQPLGLMDSVHWFIGSITPMDMIVAPASDHWQLAKIVAIVGLALGVLIALWFAKHVVRSRQLVEEAQEQVEATQDEMRELGSYRLLKKIGAGGMGEVWQGEHKMLARRAAIKLIKRKNLHFEDPDEVQRTIERFKWEAKVTARLCSPNTVQLYDYGVSKDGTLYYVMEMLDGMDFDDLVEKHGPQPVERVMYLLRCVASSLAEAHKLELVHRDIKPANLFICRMGIDVDVVKVLDFGLVLNAPRQKENRLTMEGMVTGTPSYMAPEQATGSEVDERCDIYALACVAYYLLSARDVFENENPHKVLMAHVYEPAPRISELAKQEIPQALDELLMNCLAKEPGDRPRNMEVLIKSLDNIAQDLDLKWTLEKRQDWWNNQCPYQDCGEDDPCTAAAHLEVSFLDTETSAAEVAIKK